MRDQFNLGGRRNQTSALIALLLMLVMYSNANGELLDVNRERAFGDAGFERTSAVLSSTRITLYQAASQGVSRGIFVYSHGMTSRVTNHLKLLQAVNSAGFDVVAYDLPGHGTSERYWHNTNGSVRSSEELLSVLGGVIAHARYAFGNEKSVVLSGWSLGGLLTTVYLQRNPGDATSAVLFAPGVSLAIMRGNPLMVLNLKPQRISELLGVNTYKLVHDRDEAKYLRDDPSFFAFPPVSLATALVKLWLGGKSEEVQNSVRRIYRGRRCFRLYSRSESVLLKGWKGEQLPNDTPWVCKKLPRYR